MPRTGKKHPKLPGLELYDRETYYKIEHPDGLRPWVFKRSWGHQNRQVYSHALLAYDVFKEGWCVCMTVGNKDADELLSLVHREYDRNDWMTKHLWVSITQVTDGQYAHLMIDGNHENYQHKQKRIVHSGIK